MFTTAVRIEHDLGVPSVSLNALTGHRSCAPEDCSGLVANPPQGPVPVSGVFPAGAVLHLLETRLQAIRLSPYRADLPARHPVRLGVSCRFPGMLFSPGYPFGTGSAIRSRDISSRPCPLRGRYNSAPHGAPTTIGAPSPWSSRPLGDPAVRLRCTYRTRRRPPTHPLDRPRWTAPRATEVARSHGSCPSMARRRLRASFRRMRTFIVGDWASSNPALAISRGSCGTPPWTPPDGHRFPDMLFSP